jgi:transposase
LSGKVGLEVTMDVKSDTLKPIIEHYIEKDSIIYTDDYAVYNFLASSGYIHESVNHSAGEYARGEVHINT